MKKKLVTILTAISLVATLTACGNSNGSSKYVTLGEFEGLEVEVEKTEVTDSAVESYGKQQLDYYVENYGLYDTEAITDRTDVQTGDVVNIDFEGLKDGVAFEGGTATATNLEIGSNSFIEGFESGLIGAKVGDQVSLNLTFPAEYDNADLAGAAVVFNVKINSINTKKPAVYNDALIAKLQMGFTTMDEYYASVKTTLEEQATSTFEESKSTKVWEAVKGVCTVKEIPQDLVDEQVATFQTKLDEYVTESGQTMEDYLASMGTTQEQFTEEITTYAEQNVEQTLIVEAIAAKQKLKVTDDEYKAKLAEEAAAAGYAEGKYEDYISDYYLSEQKYRDQLLYNEVMDYLFTVITVKEVKAAEVPTEDALDITVSGNEETISVNTVSVDAVSADAVSSDSAE